MCNKNVHFVNSIYTSGIKMDFNSNKQAISSSEVNNSYLHNENESKLITASADFIPAFFSPNGVLKKENENNKPNILEILIQSEDFFKEHPNSFQKDELVLLLLTNLLVPPENGVFLF